MTKPVDMTGLDPREAATTWLRAFDAAVARADVKAAAALFLPDGHWRDLVSFTWHIVTMNGTAEIEAGLHSGRCLAPGRRMSMSRRIVWRLGWLRERAC